MKTITFEGFGRYLRLKVGKKKLIQIDLVPTIMELMNISKSEAKKLITDGAIDMTADIREEI